MKGYTKQQAHELGYRMAYTLEKLLAEAPSAERELAFLIAGDRVMKAAALAITSHDAAAYLLAGSFASGQSEGKRAAIAAIKGEAASA